MDRKRQYISQNREDSSLPSHNSWISLTSLKPWQQPSRTTEGPHSSHPPAESVPTPPHPSLQPSPPHHQPASPSPSASPAPFQQPSFAFYSQQLWWYSWLQKWWDLFSLLAGDNNVLFYHIVHMAEMMQWWWDQKCHMFDGRALVVRFVVRGMIVVVVACWWEVLVLDSGWWMWGRIDRLALRELDVHVFFVHTWWWLRGVIFM